MARFIVHCHVCAAMEFVEAPASSSKADVYLIAISQHDGWRTTLRLPTRQAFICCAHPDCLKIAYNEDRTLTEAAERTFKEY